MFFSKIDKQERGAAPLKLAYVIPWFGKGISGGSEAACLQAVSALKRYQPQVDVEVLTTCLKEFAADWNQHVYDSGLHIEDGLDVRRFRVKKHYYRRRFDRINAEKLMRSGSDDLWCEGRSLSPLTDREETYFLERMIRSPEMERFIKVNREAYDFFIFVPYMFGTSYFGSLIAGDRAIMEPALHDERYIYLRSYKRMMEGAWAAMYHNRQEDLLANRMYNLNPSRQRTIGQVVEVDVELGNPERFRIHYGIGSPFILYVGRKETGKNLPYLVECYQAYRRDFPDTHLKLVILGRGPLDYRDQEGVYDLGFVDSATKRDALSASLALCQPSTNESFSIVMMESWLQGRPPLVNGLCAVTRDHCEISQGGLYFNNSEEFAAAIQHWLDKPDLAVRMGQLGMKYVQDNFAPKVFASRLVEFLMEMKTFRVADHPAAAARLEPSDRV